MASNAKYFDRDQHFEETIKDGNGVIGTIRVKPSTVMWCPKGAKGPKPYFGVTIEDFKEWIMTTSKAKKMAQ